MSNSGNWLRVRVTDMNTGKSKANVKIPAGLVEFGLKMATKYTPDSLDGMDMSEIIAAVKSGAEGMLVDVEDVEKGERVEVSVE